MGEPLFGEFNIGHGPHPLTPTDSGFSNWGVHNLSDDTPHPADELYDNSPPPVERIAPLASLVVGSLHDNQSPLPGTEDTDPHETVREILDSPDPSEPAGGNPNTDSLF